MTTVALMYHRIVPRRSDTECYFARGTAVEPETFRTQIEWLASQFNPITPSEWWTNRTDSRSNVILTVDDGYRDVVDYVGPICQTAGIPFSVYPIAGHTAEALNACWIDIWYDLVQRSHWRPDLAAVLSEEFSLGQPPSPKQDMSWWVKGPIKELLRNAGSKRDGLLARLAALLDTPVGRELSSKLYCSRQDLTQLVADGIEVGGHGWKHRSLATINDSERQKEISEARNLLDTIKAPEPRSFCYPNGSCNDEVEIQVATGGFSTAFTVESGFIEPGCNPYRLPRFIVRNHPPSDPAWCAAFTGQLMRSSI